MSAAPLWSDRRVRLGTGAIGGVFIALMLLKVHWFLSAVIQSRDPQVIMPYNAQNVVRLNGFVWVHLVEDLREPLCAAGKSVRTWVKYEDNDQSKPERFWIQLRETQPIASKPGRYDGYIRIGSDELPPNEPGWFLKGDFYTGCGLFGFLNRDLPSSSKPSPYVPAGVP